MMVQVQKTAQMNEAAQRGCDHPAARKALLAACCAKKQRLLPSAGQVPGKQALVSIDLVILIDTSDSMRDDIEQGLLSAVGDAVEIIRNGCATPLRVQWLGIEGAWPGTPCQQSYRNYLLALGIPEADLLGRRRDSLPHQGAQEDGARAIIDIAHHYDWRPGAWRGLLFLGDEGLAGGNPTDAEDSAAAATTAAAAAACNITVFTYAGTGSDGKHPDLATEAAYLRLALATGGGAYRTPHADLRRFAADLQAHVCPAATENGGAVVIEPVQPCFTLAWGDSAADQIETDDRETIAIVAGNPYTNVIFHDLMLVSSQLYWNRDQPVPPLPDGTPSVTMTPGRLIDFGTVDRSTATDVAAVTRMVELVSRGSRPGSYTCVICCQYTAEIVLTATDEFRLDLVAS